MRTPESRKAQTINAVCTETVYRANFLLTLASLDVSVPIDFRDLAVQAKRRRRKSQHETRRYTRQCYAKGDVTTVTC